MMIYRQNHIARGTPGSFVRQENEDRQEVSAARPARTIRRRQLLPSVRRVRDRTITAPILLEVERWLKRHDLTASQFGKAAIGDPNLVGDLRDGRQPSTRTNARIRAFIEREG